MGRMFQFNLKTELKTQNTFLNQFFTASDWIDHLSDWSYFSPVEKNIIGIYLAYLIFFSCQMNFLVMYTSYNSLYQFLLQFIYCTQFHIYFECIIYLFPVSLLNDTMRKYNWDYVTDSRIVVTPIESHIDASSTGPFFPHAWLWLGH